MSTTYKKGKASEEILGKIRQEIDSRGGIIKTENLDAMGIDYRRVLDYVETGELVRIKNGYYTDRIDRFTEPELIAKLFPDALLCMESALFAYGYITEKPFGWRLAVDKNTSKSRFHMDYPKVIPYYTEPEALEIGASVIELEGCCFRIYDRERVICDCLKYESKMERETFKAAVLAYIRDEEKDVSLLLEYAKARRVLKKVQGLIGVWL